MTETAATACVLIIGNEVLSGRTREANLQHLGRELAALGIPVREARVVVDDVDVIAETVNVARAAHDYVFTTGGIGPTHDDITAAGVAKAFGVPVERNAEALALLRQQYAPGDLNAARMKMADVPAGAELLENPVSRAPGFRLANVYVLPGVPAIMRAMFDLVKPGLRGGSPVRSRTVAVFLPEGQVAAPLARVQAAHPTTEIGSYPFLRDGRLGTSLVVRGTDATTVAAAAEAVQAMIRAAGAEPIDEGEA